MNKQEFETDGDTTFIVIVSPKFGTHRVPISTSCVERAAAFRWFVGRYITSSSSVGGKFVTTYLHRLVTGAPAGLEVDHIDHNTFNNRLGNLRLTTRSGNARNARKPRGSSGYIGVAWDAEKGRWLVNCRDNGRHVFLGRYDDVHEAGRVSHEWRNAHCPTWLLAGTPFTINEANGET